MVSYYQMKVEGIYMRKLSVLLLALVLAVGTIGCGTETKNKETTKKVVEKNEAVEDTVNEDVKKEETREDDKTETSFKDVAGSNQDSKTKTDTSKNTTNKTSTTKPSQTVTQPTIGHVHNWTEVKTQVAVPEKGHYETVFEWKTKCCECDMELTHMSKEEQDEHFSIEPCKGGIKRTWREEAGQKWIVDTPATTEARVTGYKCSCGATREKTQYAGMYTLRDQASWDRLNECLKFFKQGLAGDASELDGNWVTYGNWESVLVCNGSSDGAWMWIFIRDWKLDDYSYLQDSVKEGIIDQEEARLVEALYEEIPSIFKGAIERVAPQGGTELYNYTLNLINQAGGNPDAVPSLSGAQGLIPENIPGLYVTIDELRGGFALTFWAE